MAIEQHLEIPSDHETARPQCRVEGSDIAAISGVTPANPFHIAASFQVAAINAWADSMLSSQQAWSDAAKHTASFMRMNPAFALWQDATQQQFDQWMLQFVPAAQREKGASAGGRYYAFTKNILQQMIEAMPEPYRGLIQHRLMHDGPLQEMMRSDHMAELLQKIGDGMPGQGMLYQERYNHKFLTENGDGTIVEMNADHVAQLFPKGTVEDATTREIFPHIILTSSHAQGETLKDVTSITHGIEALARDSAKQSLPIGYDGSVKPGQTLMLYACDTERNPFHNAAALLRRINALKEVEKNGALETDFKHISPGAKRLAKLMLKCMADDPTQVDVNQPDLLAKTHTGGPIKLRDDALVVAHHFQLIGYSKGGNVVSDALRYLIGELTAKNDAGVAAFTLNGGAGMTQHQIKGLVRSIEVMAIAAIEVGVTQQLKDYGMRRVAFNNNHDAISAHHNYEGTTYDERWLIEGATQHLGHAPQDMMGTRDAIVGYAHADPRVERRLKEYFASNYGKAALSNVHFDGNAWNGRIIVEAATGTTDAQIEAYRGPIMRAFEIVGLRGATLTNDESNPGIFILDVPGKNFAQDTRALQMVKKSFEYLREHTKGLVITQTIIDKEIQGQIDSVLPDAARHLCQVNRNAQIGAAR